MDTKNTHLANLGILKRFSSVIRVIEINVFASFLVSKTLRSIYSTAFFKFIERERGGFSKDREN